MHPSSDHALQLLDDQLRQLIVGCESMRRTIAELKNPKRDDRPSDDADKPVVDKQRREVRWRGRCCFLGDTRRFYVIEKLCEHPGWLIESDKLLHDIWRDYSAEHATLHSTVRQLKKKLIAAGMTDLAAAIRGERHGYILDLAQDD